MQKYIDARKGAPQTTKNNVKFQGHSRNESDYVHNSTSTNNFSGADLKIQRKSTIQLTQSNKEQKLGTAYSSTRLHEVQHRKQKSLLTDVVLQSQSSILEDEDLEKETHNFLKSQALHGKSTSNLELEKVKSDKSNKFVTKLKKPTQFNQTKDKMQIQTKLSGNHPVSNGPNTCQHNATKTGMKDSKISFIQKQ